MAHAQKPDFVFQRNGQVHLNGQGSQFRRLLAAEVCASAVVMLDTPCSVVVWRVLATHSIRQFPLHFPSHASPSAITFQLNSTLMNVSNVIGGDMDGPRFGAVGEPCTPRTDHPSRACFIWGLWPTRKCAMELKGF